MAVSIEIRFVDGGLDDSISGDHYLQNYRKLKAEGYEGKKLIHELLTDDWGAPPHTVTIREDSRVVAVIPYE